MQEIATTTVNIKLSDGHENQYVLVHDGQQVIELLEPGTGKVGTCESNSMVVGSKEEVDAEIARLQLKPKRARTPERRPVTGESS